MARILLTRPTKQSESFAAALAQHGWTAAIWPLLSIRPMLHQPIEPTRDQSLIFTSARAVEVLPDPAPIDASVVCVGPATAAAARLKGFCRVTDIAGDAEALIHALKREESSRYIHIRGAHTRGDVAARLTEAGNPTTELIAYEAVATKEAPSEIDSEIMAGNIDAIALFSPRSASIFKRLVSAEWMARLSTATVYAISPAVAEPVSNMGFAKVVLAKRPNGSSMRAAICGVEEE